VQAITLTEAEHTLKLTRESLLERYRGKVIIYDLHPDPSKIQVTQIGEEFVNGWMYADRAKPMNEVK
jgi:hypothetical protein